MPRRTRTIVVISIVAVCVGAVTVEVLTSSAPGSPCAGISTPSSNVTSSDLAARAVPTSPAHPVAHALNPPAVVARGDAISPLSVVAAENFWGSLVSQLGGNQTDVLSVVNDPNTDPHEYEANASVARAITNAPLVIVNGVGYDDWALQIIASDGNPNQIVLNVGDVNGVSVGGGILGGNPHMWYNPDYVNATVAAMYSDLVGLRPSATTYFQAQYSTLNASLGQLYGQAAAIRSHFAGTVVAATESIFVYLANFTHLNLVSPPAFMEAVAEGNDPPTQSVVEFQCQLQSGHVKVLVYNQQTVTPVTDNMKSMAASNGVAVVGITETIQPPTYTFQEWMGAEYLTLYNALNANALGR